MKNVIIIIALFSYVELSFAQNKLEVGVSLSIIKFSDFNASIIGDKYLFQIPSLNATYQFNNRLSIGVEWTFNTFNDLGLLSNSVNYNSYGGHLRYSFKRESNFLNPYVVLGSTIVKSENYAIPTLNFGIGNTYWINDKVGINAQIIYKFSALEFQSMRPHFQFSTGLIYRFDFNLFSSDRNRIWEINH